MKTIVYIIAYYFLVSANINFAQSVNKNIAKSGMLIIKGKVFANEKPIQECSITLNSIFPLIRKIDGKRFDWARCFSTKDGTYQMKIPVNNFYCQDRYELAYYKEGYATKYIHAFLILPKDISQSSFTLELPLEMTPKSNSDSTQCGVIAWSDEKKNFIITWITCAETVPNSSTPVFQPKPGEKIILKNIFFETNKSQLLPLSFEELNKLAEYLRNNRNTLVEVAGHTDNSGLEDNNRTLSGARARAVVEYLISKGIEKSRTSYKGFGSTKPIAQNDTEEGKQKNRRVEFVIKKNIL
jgi:outer membrane protein OmpA-like peptidoglycan-associated protein